MSYFFPNIDETYLYKRRGTEADPYIYLEDKQMVKRSSIVLKEIPAFTKKVEAVTDKGQKLKEVNVDKPKSGEFRVDYSQGHIYLNENLNNTFVTVKYWGTGYVAMSTNRIWLASGEDEPLETLQNALDNIDDGLEVIENVSDMQFMGEYSPSVQYKNWNFILFNNKTYVALEHIKGKSPIESPSSWQLVSSGFGFAGIFQPDRSYSIGDVVTSHRKQELYISLVDNNISPLSDNKAWMDIVDFEGKLKDVDKIVKEEIAKVNKVSDEMVAKDKIRDENEEEREGRLNNALATVELSRDEILELLELIESDENERKGAENLRASSEEVRANQEKQRESNEQTRQNAEDRRNSSILSIEDTLTEALEGIDKSLEDMWNNKEEIEEILAETEVAMETTQAIADDLAGWEYRGEYSPTELYQIHNMVRYNGSMYIALVSNLDIAPDDDETWALVVEKGEDGTALTINGMEPDEEGDFDLGVLNLATAEELAQVESELNTSIGKTTDLITDEKSDLVGAINELKRRVDELKDIVNINT